LRVRFRTDDGIQGVHGSEALPKRIAPSVK
jgi:hypothetical protein